MKELEEFKKQFNKKCAIFLNYRYVTHQDSKDFGVPAGWYKRVPKVYNQKINSSLFLGRSLKDLRFYGDWNWIMLVVDKIESLYDDFHGYFPVYIHSNCCTIQGTKLRTGVDDFHPAYFAETYEESKKLATIIAIDKFIDWYNKEGYGRL